MADIKKRKITFNKDGTRTVEENGITNTFDKKTYEDRMHIQQLIATGQGSKLGSGAMPGEDEQKRAENFAVFKAQQQQQTTTPTSITTTGQNNVPQNNIQTPQQQPQQNPNDLTNIDSAKQFDPQTTQLLMDLETAGGKNIYDIQKQLEIKKINQDLQTNAQTNPVGARITALKDMGILSLHAISDVLDNVGTSVKNMFNATNPNTSDVSQAIKNIDDSKKVIDDQIKQIPNGTVDRELLISQINKYEYNLAYLESTNKRKGLDNLQYWIKGGGKLDGEIEMRKIELDQMKRDFDAARLSLNANAQMQQQFQQQQLIKQQMGL